MSVCAGSGRTVNSICLLVSTWNFWAPSSRRYRDTFPRAARTLRCNAGSENGIQRSHPTFLLSGVPRRRWRRFGAQKWFRQAPHLRCSVPQLSLLCPARGDVGLRSEHKGLHIFDTARGPPSNLAWAGSRPIFDDCGNHIERQRLADGRRWLWVVAFSSQRASTYPRGDNYIHRFDHRIPVVGVKSV